MFGVSRGQDVVSKWVVHPNFPKYLFNMITTDETICKPSQQQTWQCALRFIQIIMSFVLSINHLFQFFLLKFHYEFRRNTFDFVGWRFVCDASGNIIGSSHSLTLCTWNVVPIRNWRSWWRIIWTRSAATDLRNMSLRMVGVNALIHLEVCGVCAVDSDGWMSVFTAIHTLPRCDCVVDVVVVVVVLVVVVAHA